MDGPELIDAWRATIVGSNKSWVLFENGTCVVLPYPPPPANPAATDPTADLAAQATALLREWGPVHARFPFDYFATIALANGLGWLVTSHHNDIYTFVGLDEAGPAADESAIGLLGRSRRGQDAEGLRVIHVEDKRPRV